MSEETKPAFLVVCSTTIGEMDPEYLKGAIGPAKKANLLPIAGDEVGKQVEVLEGSLPEGTSFLAIEQFPSMKVLKAFYHSEEYQGAIPFRESAFDMNFLAAVDGISEAELKARARKAASSSES